MPAMARAALESLLRTRKLDVTLTGAAAWRDQAADRLAPTGMAALDSTLGGGLRRGHLSEIVGARSSGRTTLVLHACAAATARGELVAFVDLHDRLDPVSAAAAGVDLSRLLWVRDSGNASRAIKAMNLILQAGDFGIVALDIADARPPVLREFPLTTWMRLSRIIEGSQTVALIVAGQHIARSPGGVTIAIDTPAATAGRWIGTADRARLLNGIDSRPRVIGGKLGESTGISDVSRATCYDVPRAGEAG
jgi:recombination protein RecA